MSNIILGRLISYIDQSIEDKQCGFRPNRSITDQTFYIRLILDKIGIQGHSKSVICTRRIHKLSFPLVPQLLKHLLREATAYT